MDPYPAFLREELAARQMERSVAAYGDRARDDLRTIPDWAITPALFALIATTLNSMADQLPPSAREVAKGHITDLFCDMEGFANEH